MGKLARFEGQIRILGQFFVWALSLVFLIVLFVINLNHTGFTYNTDYPLTTIDSLFINALKLGLGLIIFVSSFFWARFLSKRGLIYLLIVFNLGLLSLKLYMVISFNNYPTIDAYQIYNGVQVLQFTNDIRPLYIGNYFATYPQQLGIVTLLRPLAVLFHDKINHYFFFQAVLSQTTIIVFSIAVYLKKNLRVAFYTNLLLNLFLPNISIIFLIYGDLYALFFLSLGFLLYVLMDKYRIRKSLYLLILIMLSFAYIARLSSNVIILSILFTVFLTQSFSVKKYLVMASLLLVLLIPLKALNSFYNTSDVELGAYAQPNSTWVRIGLGFGGGNSMYAGVHNGQVETDFMVLAYNPLEMDVLNQSIIKNQIGNLLKDYKWVSFFKEKLKIMWTDPDFEISTLLLPIHAGKIKNPWKHLIEVGNYGYGSFNLSVNNSFGQWIQDHYFNLRSYEKAFYLGLLSSLFGVLLLKSKQDKTTLFLRLSLIGYILLHLLLEVKSRYVYGFINIVIVIVSIKIYELFSELFDRYHHKIQGDKK